MKVEYKLEIEGKFEVEQLITILMDAGYIVSKERTIFEHYEVSIYGKGGEEKETVAKPKGGPLPTHDWGFIGSGEIKCQPNTVDAVSTKLPYIPTKDKTLWMDTTMGDFEAKNKSSKF